MFSKIITNTPLNTQDAEDQLGYLRATGVSFGSSMDLSMLSTLRALLSKRVPSDEVVQFLYINRGYTAETIGDNSVADILKAMCGSCSSLLKENTIYLHEFCLANDDDIMANIALVKSSFTKQYKKWVKIDNITAFFAGKFEAHCFIEPNLKSVYLFTSKLTPRLYHYIQCALPAMMPWFFKESPLTEIELELMHSLTESSETKYLETIKKIADKYDFRAMGIKRRLGDFEKKCINKQVSNTERTLASIKSSIDNYNAAIRDKLVERDEQLALLCGYRARLKDDCESELISYFLANKKLSLVEVSNTKVYFTVKDYLSYFDDEEAKTYIENDRSYIYNDYGGNIPQADIKLLMTEIFIKKRLKARVCAEFCYDVGCELKPIRFANFSSAEYSEYTPNPHLDKHQCLGNNRPLINESVAAGDTIMVIEQCIASTKNLNFRDSTVMSDFMSTINENPYSGYNYRFIELPNGNVVQPKEAIKWLKEEETVKDE